MSQLLSTFLYISLSPGVGVTDSVFLLSIILPVFQNSQNASYLLNTTFMFDMWSHSLDAVTPAKYECDSKDLTITFAKLNNRAS